MGDPTPKTILCVYLIAALPVFILCLVNNIGGIGSAILGFLAGVVLLGIIGFIIER
jgi:hypothetical protein